MLTKESGLMLSGRELDAAVMVYLFGWQWMRRKDAMLCSLIPPEGSEWERFNWHGPSWEALDHWPIDAERFTDWTSGGMRRRDRTLEGMPSPSTEIADAWDVFLKGLMLTGNASVDADMENYGRGMFTQGHASGDVTVTIGDWTVFGPVCQSVCRAALLNVLKQEEVGADG